MMKISIWLLSLLAVPFLGGSLFSGNPLIPVGIDSQSSQTASCIETNGKIDTFLFESEILKRPLEYKVYTPPCYDDTGSTSYPVLYLLHGSSSSNEQWIKLGLQSAADELISTGKITPFLIVLPREAAYLEDTRTSKYGQAILQELMPRVEEEWKLGTTPELTAIGGLSRGAGWAIHLGLANPERFGSVGAHSLALFYADINQIEKWRKQTDADDLPRLYLDMGMEDYLKDSAKKFELKLSEFSYPHEWHLNPGTHNEVYWSAHLNDYLRWYSRGWEDASVGS